MLTNILLIASLLHYVCSACPCGHVNALPPPSDEDEAVARERRLVLKEDCAGDLLVLNNLTKVYNGSCGSSQRRLAVNQLCLRMQKAEVCFQNFFLCRLLLCVFCVSVLVYWE